MKEIRAALVTGASRGIGRGIALRLAREGYAVVLNSRTADPAERTRGVYEVQRTIEAAGGKAAVFRADISSAGERRALIGFLDREFPRLDLLVNNAGIEPEPLDMLDGPEERLERVLAVNLKAVFLCCRAVLKQMIKQKSGSIVSISGTAGKEGMALRGSLCAAKWGLLGLTQTIAKEAGPHGIRANVICPGGMDEPDLRVMYAERAKGLGMEFSDLEKSVLELTPLRKYARHDEVAKAALFLASSDSSHTTGESLNVSGGRLMN